MEKLGLIRVLPPPHRSCIIPCDIFHFVYLNWKLEEKHFFPGKQHYSRCLAILEEISINICENVPTI
jgi:hypothetical protein